MTSLGKVLIVGAAGVCLVLVKLIQAGFYLNPKIPTYDVWGAFLTAGAFLVISVIVMEFADESNPRKLFMQGLTAPSFLIAALSQPTIGTSAGDQSAALMPRIDELPGTALLIAPTVHAEERDPANEGEDDFAIETLSRARYEGSLADGARRFVGRTPKQQPPHAYIIGKTSDPDHARKIAILYKDLLDNQDVRLLKPEGSETICLSLGEFGSPRAVSEGIKSTLRCMEPDDNVDWKYLSALINGQVVNLRTLSQLAPAP